MDLYLVELTVYDPTIGSPRVLRYASGEGHITGPAETPANATYLPRLVQPAVLRRSMFRDGATFGRSQQSVGEIVLNNADGALDALQTYGFDGQEFTVRRGTVSAAYPSGFPAITRGVMETCEVTRERVTIRVRDQMLALTVPFQDRKYAGTGGLEGGSDLTGKPRPLTLGVVKNVPAVLVDPAKLIYQVHDWPIASVDAVYDKGIRLYSGSWPTASTFANFHEVWACRFGGGQYVVVGYDTTALVGRISTSPDGVTWTPRSSATINQNLIKWFTVAYSPTLGLYVAAGTSGTLITSPDGVTWTSRTSGTAQRIIDCAWSEDAAVFVYGAVTGVCASSPDGVTWTARTSNSGGNDINGLSFGAGLFVGGCSGGYLITSPDGITWTSRTNSFGGAVVRSVCYGQAVGGVGLFVGVGDGGVVITSVDGSTWAIQRLTGVATNLYRVAFADGQFLTVGQTGTMITSPDGINWTSASPGFGSTYIYHLTYGTGGWLIVGDASKYGLANAYRMYADEFELKDDSLAPTPGEAKVYLAGGYVRLGATPAGLVTTDVTEGLTAADRTVAQVFARALQTRGYPITQWNSDDLAALDVLLTAVCGGFWSEETTIAAVLDQLAQSARAWWGPDATGILRLKRFVAPTGGGLAVGENQVLRLERVPARDAARGIPVFRSIVRYGRFYAVQTTDLAGGVTDARRADLAKEWREALAEDAAVPTKHPLAGQIVEETLLAVAANAQSEATARQALRGVDRDVFELGIALTDETDGLNLSGELNLTHTRFNLSSGRNLVVIGVEPDPAKREVNLTLWG